MSNVKLRVGGLDLLFTKVSEVRVERVWRDSTRNSVFDTFHLSFLIDISIHWQGGSFI